MPELTTLSSKIFELRKKMKLTQVQLGKKVGVSGGAISHFEKALTKPNSETLRKLSDVLSFDLSEIAKKKQGPSSSDLHRARVELLSAEVWHDKYEREYGTSYDPSYRGPDQVEFSEETIIFRQKDFIEFLEYKQKRPSAYFQKEHLALPGIDYRSAVILEIQGSSMYPRYPDQSRYLFFPVEDDHWQYATGVHIIWLKSKKMFLKRIISNKSGVLILSSDSNGEQTTVELEDIASLWKAGQAIHLPPEEL